MIPQPRTRRVKPDLIAVIGLVALWALFFWRLLTPIAGDQASLKQGDFSGQFVAFAGYQYARFSESEIPLWDPYNNGGLPFIADTQAAVFYPPRLLTLAFARLAGGWSYHALELEMAGHLLAYSLLMYLLLRRLTGAILAPSGSAAASMIGALVGAYGGFMTGYAPLQLAILEAATWLPLALLGLTLARAPGRRGWGLGIAGLGLGLSWMAGHPQTSYFLTLLMIGYWGWSIYVERARWTLFVFGVLAFGALAGALAAVQLLPGIEYLTHTARLDLTYDAKGNGFPFQDVLQFAIPGVVSLFSPLYVGIFGFIFALIAVWRRVAGARFWGAVALIGLLWSFGANSALYPLLYNLLPGLRFFRGQERAAFLVAASAALLAGMGAAALLAWGRAPGGILSEGKDYLALLRLRLVLNRAALGFGALTALVLVAWLGNPAGYSALMPRFAFAWLLIALAAWLLPLLPLGRVPSWAASLMLIAIVTFELFSVNLDNSATYDAVPPAEQFSLTPPPLVAQALAEPAAAPFRVDGARGLTDNYGSLYGLADMRGISPLFMSDAYRLIEGDMPDAVAWELFAVRDVFSDWQELPVPSQIVAAGTDRYGAVNLHRLNDPRPFALFMAEAQTAAGEAAFDLMRAGAVNLRATVLLEQPAAALSIGSAQVVDFAPEQIVIETTNDGDGLLSISLPYYPGWLAAIDDQPAPILRAYQALSAVAVPAGEHILTLVYNPLSYRIGALISLVAWAGLAAAGIVGGLRMRRL